MSKLLPSVKQIRLACISASFFFTCSIYGQTSTVDSLEHLLSIAHVDTQKISVLLSLSEKYKGIDGQKAIETAASAVDLSRQIGAIRWIALSEHRLGTAYRRKREFESAILHLSEAEKAYHAQGDLIHAAEMPIDVGICFASLGNIELALDTMAYSARLYAQLLSSPDSAQSNQAKTGVLWSYYFSFTSLYDANQLQRALGFLMKTEKVALDFGLVEALPNIHNSFGVTYVDLGDYEKALEYYIKALTMAEESGGWDDQQRLLDNISRIHVRKGEYVRARELLQRAVSILLAHLPERVEYLARLYNSLADVNTRIARYVDALEYYLKALRVFDQIGSLNDVAKIKTAIGSFYLLQGNYPSAIDNLQEARRLYEQLNNTAGVSNAVFELATIMADQGRADEALTFHRQSLEIRRKSGEKFSILLSTYEIGHVFLIIAGDMPHGRLPDTVQGGPRTRATLNAMDSASSYFSKGVEMSRSLSDDNIGAKCFYGLGRIEELRGNLRQALGYYDKTRALCDSLGMKRELYESYLALASVSSRLGMYDDAYRYHTSYVLVKDSVFNESQSRQMKEMEAKYESEKKDRDIEELNRQNEITALKVKGQQSALRQAQLEAERQQSDITLLNQTKELQQQQLLNANSVLTERELEANAKSAELDAARKDQLLQEHDLQEQKLIMYGSIAFAILTIALGLVLFNRFQLRKALDKRAAILDERRRISSDMHDDLGSSLSTIALLSQVMKQHASGAQDRTEVEKISIAAQQSLEKMSEIVWSLNPRNDKLANLVAYIRKYAVEYFDNSPVQCDVTMSGTIPDVELNGEQRRNVFLTIKESLHNIIKHSGASRATLAFEFVDHTVLLSVHDNGKGIDVNKKNAFGNGIANMQRRMKEAGGEMAIENQNGTTVMLRLPLA